MADNEVIEKLNEEETENTKDDQNTIPNDSSTADKLIQNRNTWDFEFYSKEKKILKEPVLPSIKIYEKS